MKIPRMTVITLGVSSLHRATAFYGDIFATAPITQYEGVTFFPLPGTWLALYPLDKLAEDVGIQPAAPASAEGHASPLIHGTGHDVYTAGRRGHASQQTHQAFRGVTLAYNARSKEEIAAIFERVARAGAYIAKTPQDTFWGGHSGYFADPDGHYWEVAWGPMFGFDERGELRFKP